MAARKMVITVDVCEDDESQCGTCRMAYLNSSDPSCVLFGDLGDAFDRHPKCMKATDEYKGES